MSGDHQSLIGIIAGTLCCLGAFDCNLAFDKYGGILMWIAVMLYMFKALGTICDEYFVPSLEVIVEKLQLSNDVAGATFMAAGSSAPELFTSLVATFLIVNEGGVGTIVGSAIFNILVIVGATGYIACKEQKLRIWWYPLCRDCFFYSLSILELMIIISNESVEWYEGLIMFFTYVSYCVYMKFNPKIVSMLGLVDPSAEKEDAVETVEETVTQVAEAPKGVADGEPDTLRTIGHGMGDKIEDTKQPEVIGDVAVAVTVGAPATGVPAEPAAPGTVEEAKAPAVEGVKLLSVETATERSPSKGSANKEGPRRPSWSLKETTQNSPRKPSKEPIADGAVAPADATTAEKPAGAADEAAAEDEAPPLKGIWRILRDPLNVFWEVTMPRPELMGGGMLFALSILFIGMCTYLMVDATNRIGVILHIPPLAMALVFLAAGTSIPDALGSIAVAKQGEGDMAVANALGSNVFDILIGLGVPWFIKTGIMGQEVKFVGKWDELKYDIIVLVFVLLLFVGCLAVHKWYLTRQVGILLLCMYVGFLIYNVFAVWVIDPPLKAQSAAVACDVI